MGKLGGFIYELPGISYGQNIYAFAEAVNYVIAVLSDNDPAFMHCMDSNLISTNKWIFEFNSVKMRVVTFAPFYLKTSNRYTFKLPNCYILFQNTNIPKRRDNNFIVSSKIKHKHLNSNYTQHLFE